MLVLVRFAKINGEKVSVQWNFGIFLCQMVLYYLRFLMISTQVWKSYFCRLFSFQRVVFIYQKDQRTLGSRLFYFCINLIVIWALGSAWGLFFEEWWTFGFRKFISKHGSILYVDREWRVCAGVSCRYNFSIKIKRAGVK